MATSKPEKKFVVAKYNFEAEEENEVACNAGEIFEVLDDLHADWLLVVCEISHNSNRNESNIVLISRTRRRGTPQKVGFHATMLHRVVHHSRSHNHSQPE